MLLALLNNILFNWRFSVADDRSRLWTCILYPDDLKNYHIIPLLESLNVPCVLSPLHFPDKDNINPEEQRKKHFHLMLTFEGKKSEAQVKFMLMSIFPGMRGCSKPIPVHSAKALVRYFLHLDQPEKQQFDAKWQALTCMGGFKLDDYLEPSSSEKYKYIRQMRAYCVEHDIYELSDLMLICDDLYPDTWGYVLSMCCTNSMKAFLDSRRYKYEQHKKKLQEASLKEKFNKI